MMIFVFDLLILAFVIGSDLVSKELVTMFLDEYESYNILENIFSFKYVKNTGASFGVFAGKQDMLIGLTCIVMIALVAFLIWQKDMPKPLRLATLFILGGGIGNLYDRIAFNYVRDFIEYDFLDIILENLFGTQFAIGNIADIYLCVGVLMVIIYVIFAFDEKDFSMKWKRKVSYE